MRKIILLFAAENSVSFGFLSKKLGSQGSHRLEKYLNLEDFLEKLKIKSALKSTGKSLKSLEKSLNYTIFCKT